MEIIELYRKHSMWNETVNYAEHCQWKAGKNLAKLMREEKLEGFERVFIAVENGNIIGFCTLTKKDSLDRKYLYSPFIGYIFVDEAHRGRRISEAMIRRVLDYARINGFGRVYISSGEVGLYEKYGFRLLGMYDTIYGTKEQLFVIPT